MTTRRVARPGRPDAQPMRLLLGATALGTLATFAVGIGTQPPDTASAGEESAVMRSAAAATYLVILGDRPAPAADSETARPDTRMVTPKPAPVRRRDRARTRQSG